MAIIQIPGFKCDLCGHEWLSADKDLTKLPTTCPNCKSSDWNMDANKKYDFKSKYDMRS